MLFTIFFSKFALIIRALKIKIEITFNLRLHRRPVQLVVLVPVGLSETSSGGLVDCRSFFCHPAKAVVS